jgi:hypothetical protein
MFCGECGSSTTATPLSRKRSDPSAGDTTIIQPLPPQSSVFSIPYRMPADALAGRPVVAPAHDVPPASFPAGVGEPEPPSAASSSFEPSTAAPSSAEPRAGDADAVEPVAAEATGAPAAAHFVLQFSTGEQVVVAGTGLLGRRPHALPDETFDHFVQIHDVSMSVSKSHLEFGQHNGEFWINDRMSGNGTVIRRRDDSVLRCEPGRRYLVARGSRVEIGDQFFILG